MRLALADDDTTGESEALIDNAVAESVAVPAGREEIGLVPILRQHRGSPPDLILRWNDMEEIPSGIDVVVHFHGYSSRREQMSLARDKEPFSGLDFSDPAGQPGAPSRRRPTLGVLPRGDYAGGDSGNRNRYAFPALLTSTGLRALVDFALTHFASRIRVRKLELRRLLLTAHSGGGVALLRALEHVDPDEIHVFDALYQAPNQLITWARRHLARDLDMVAAAPGTGRGSQGAMRVLYIPGTETAPHSIALARALVPALPSRHPDRAQVAARYRVERTSTTHRDIPQRYGWLFLANAAADVPDAAPATREDVAEDVVGIEEYRPAGGRAHTPVSMTFRCAPVPTVVDPASQLPQRSTTPDAAIRTALGQRLSSAQIAAFERGGGFQPLRAFAAAVGTGMLSELVARLRYSPDQLLHPPTTDRTQTERKARLGMDGPPLLAARLLMTIPGHFRQLARRSPRPSEAFVLESLGWLLMIVVRDELAAATGKRWWVPRPPGFVGRFPATPIELSSEVQALVRGPGIVDSAVSEPLLRTRFRAWQDGMPGRQWQLETGAASSTSGAGRPFYPELVQVPPPVDTSAARREVQKEWAKRVQAVESELGRGTAASVNKLTQCATGLPPGLMRTCTLRGLVMAKDYPQPATGAEVVAVHGVLEAVEPQFGRVFETIFALGWNDLLFHTAGAGCFRGKKRPKDKNNPRLGLDPQGARELSDHSIGIAVDFNTIENQQPGHGSMDPRIVAVFEAFRFRWGRCFAAPDPMHFEYCGTAC
jgi:hypothetical protein